MSRYFDEQTHYFITVPTVARHKFFDTDLKKEIVLVRIIRAAEKFSVRDLDYGINSNHYHVVGFFDNWKNISKFLNLVNGGSSFELNKIDNVQGRKVWDEYHLYWVIDSLVLNRIKGYVVGNPYKHGEVKCFNDLTDYKFSSFKNFSNKLGYELAKDFVLSSINLNLNDFKKEIEKFKKIYLP